MPKRKYEELRFSDDFMFCKILQNDPELCRKLLIRLLGREVGQLVESEKQHTVQITAQGRGVRFDVVANHPSREMALEQVLERGRSPMPNIAAPAEGDSFSFVEGRWTRVDYADADEIRY